MENNPLTPPERVTYSWASLSFSHSAGLLANGPATYHHQSFLYSLLFTLVLNHDTIIVNNMPSFHPSNAPSRTTAAQLGASDANDFVAPCDIRESIRQGSKEPATESALDMTAIPNQNREKIANTKTY